MFANIETDAESSWLWLGSFKGRVEAIDHRLQECFKGANLIDFSSNKHSRHYLKKLSAQNSRAKLIKEKPVVDYLNKIFKKGELERNEEGLVRALIDDPHYVVELYDTMGVFVLSVCLNKQFRVEGYLVTESTKLKRQVNNYGLDVIAELMCSVQVVKCIKIIQEEYDGEVLLKSRYEKLEKNEILAYIEACGFKYSERQTEKNHWNTDKMIKSIGPCFLTKDHWQRGICLQMKQNGNCNHGASCLHGFKNAGAYSFAFRNSLLDQVKAIISRNLANTSNVFPPRKTNYHWTKNKIFADIAPCFVSTSHWQRGICLQTKKLGKCIYGDNCKHGVSNYGAYNYVKKNRLINDVEIITQAHMDQVSQLVSLQKPNGYWTPATIQESALEFEFRGDWKKAYYQAWVKSRELGIREEVCQHMKSKGNLKERYIYVMFAGMYAYVGLTWDLTTRSKSHENQKHYKDLLIMASEYQVEFKVIKGPLSPEEAAVQEGIVYQKYFDDGFYMLNIAKTGGLGGGKSAKHTKANSIQTAKEYIAKGGSKVRKHFKTKHKGLWTAGKRDGWLSELEELFPLQRNQWTVELILNSSCTYATVGEWFDNDPHAYSAAANRKILDKATVHMEPQKTPNGTWTESKCIQAAKAANKLKELPRQAYKVMLNTSWGEPYLNLLRNKSRKRNLILKPTGST